MATEGQSVRSWRASLLSQLEEGGIEDSASELQALWRWRSGDDLPMSRLSVIDAALQAQLEQDVLRRARREPFAYITGAREFRSLSFRLNQACMIPRPDSETLVEAVLDHYSGRGRRGRANEALWEVGCGSGCLILSVVHALMRKNRRVHAMASDIDSRALLCARDNASCLVPRGCIRFFQADWLRVLGRAVVFPNIGGIFANPPYIRLKQMRGLEPEVARFEPRLALEGGIDGLRSFRTIFRQAKDRLALRGLLILEHGEGQAEDLLRTARRRGFTRLELRRDLAGKARVSVFVKNRGS